MPPVDHTAGGLRIQGNVPSFQLLCKIEPPSGFRLRAGMRPDPTIRRRHVPDAAGLEPGHLSSFYGSFKWRPPGSGTVALRAAYHGNMVSFDQAVARALSRLYREKYPVCKDNLFFLGRRDPV